MCDLKGAEEYNFRLQRDLRKIIDADYACLLLLKLHSYLQKFVYEHQSMDEVATDKVSELKTFVERCFPMKQVIKKQEKFSYHGWSRTLSKNVKSFTRNRERPKKKLSRIVG